MNLKKLKSEIATFEQDSKKAAKILKICSIYLSNANQRGRYCFILILSSHQRGNIWYEISKKGKMSDTRFTANV